MAVGVTGSKAQPVLQAILDINHSQDGIAIRPQRITAAQDEWRPIPPLEFYVDFETVSDLDDDFTQMPRKNGQPLIFMIGCGYVADGQWRFSCFTADQLNPLAEADIINNWLSHMANVRTRISLNHVPYVFHWSHAETSNLRDAYNAAVRRHPEYAGVWSEPAWFDFLKQVMKAQPVVVRDALSFGLKAVAQAMHKHRLISSSWESGPTDGLGAMIGAWRCSKEASMNGTHLADVQLMKEIQQYNEVDCRVMMEIVRFLREKC